MTTFGTPDAMLRSAATVVRTGGKELLWSDPHFYSDGITDWRVDVHSRLEPFPGDWESATQEEIDEWYAHAPMHYEPSILDLTVTRRHPNGRTMYARMGYSVHLLEQAAVDVMPMITKEIEMLFARCAATEAA